MTFLRKLNSCGSGDYKPIRISPNQIEVQGRGALEVSDGIATGQPMDLQPLRRESRGNRVRYAELSTFRASGSGPFATSRGRGSPRTASCERVHMKY